MAYKYQITKGNEGRVFAGGGVQNLGNGIVVSDHVLDSPYLTRVTEEQAPAPAAAAPTVPPAATPQTSVPAEPPAAPAQPQGGTN